MSTELNNVNNLLLRETQLAILRMFKYCLIVVNSLKNPDEFNFSMNSSDKCTDMGLFYCENGTNLAIVLRVCFKFHLQTVVLMQPHECHHL